MSRTALRFVGWCAIVFFGTIAADWTLVGLWEVGKWLA